MTSKAKDRKKRKEQHEKRKQERAAKWRREGVPGYNPIKYLSRNQKEVARRLIDGEVTMISSAGWVCWTKLYSRSNKWFKSDAEIH